MIVFSVAEPRTKIFSKGPRVRLNANDLSPFVKGGCCKVDKRVFKTPVSSKGGWSFSCALYPQIGTTSSIEIMCSAL